MDVTSLDKGLLLEDLQESLTWGTFIPKLIKRCKAKTSYLADRTIIDWGDHTILSGLKVNLKTTYLAPFLPLSLRRFKLIEHWAYGDKAALEDFSRISSHLLNVIGEPVQKSGILNQENEVEWTWLKDNTKMTLYLFEQHAFKLVFSLSRVQN